MDFNISFRPFTLSDAEFINNLRRKEEMEKIIGGVKRPVSYERDLKWVEDIIMKDDPRSVYFAVTLKGSDEIIGYTSISEIDYRNGTCFWSGIKVDGSKKIKGVGTEIALKILVYVFEELRMERCKGECLEHHEAMLKILLKIGYKQEGLMRKSIFKNGVHNNQWLLSILREEYIETKKTFNL